MLATTEKLLDKGFNDQVIKEWHFATIFDGTKLRQHALVNKALKKGEIIQLYRGNYVLAPKYRSPNLSKLFIANRMIPGSFISFETALSYHNFIPEKVTVVMSVIDKGRTRSFNNAFGEFEYIKIPINEYEFLTSVLRIDSGNNPFLIAKPLRALADYVYHKKIEWMKLDFLLDSMRIEMDSLKSISAKDFDEIFSIYRSKRVLNFMLNLKKSIGEING